MTDATISRSKPGVEYDLSSNSILNHAAHTLPATLLGWHYRSRSESLISFSNAAFYQGRLLTVPELALPGQVGEMVVKSSDNGLANSERLLKRSVIFTLLTMAFMKRAIAPSVGG